MKIRFYNIVLLVLLTAATFKINAQTGSNAGNYHFSTNISNTGEDWIQQVSPITLIISGKNYTASGLTEIGFDFAYEEQTYTNFSVNSHGQLRLGNTVITTHPYSAPFSSSNCSQNTPKLIPVGNYFSTGAAGFINYSIEGSAPNRILVVTYKCNNSSSTSGTNYMNFQIQLHETSNVIKFVYGSCAVAPSYYQCGIGGSNGINLQTINPTTHETTIGATSTTYSVWPGEGRCYTFTPADCFPPTSLLTSNPTTTTIDLKWSDGNPPYTLAYRAAESSEYTVIDNISATPTAENPYVLTELSSRHEYYFKVKSNCEGSSSAYSPESSFITATPLPYIDDFESYSNNTLPVGWESESTNTKILNGTSYSHSGAQCLRIYSIAKMPVMMENIATMQLEFYARADGSSNIDLQIGTYESNTFVPLHTLTITTEYRKYTVFFNGYAGSADRIVFKRTSSYSVFFDDVVVSCPSCATPYALTALNVTNNSADLRWESGSIGTPASYTVAYSVDGGEWNEITGITTTSTSMSNLTGNADYTWKVKTICQPNQPSEWSEEITFRTDCDPMTEAYFEDFEEYAYQDVPDCWKRLISYKSYGNTYPAVASSSSYSYAGSKSFVFQTYYSNNVNLITLPEFEAPVSNLQLSFYARQSTGSPNLYIGVMEDGVFQSYHLIESSEFTSTYQYYVISFADYVGSGKLVALKLDNPAGASQAVLYIDNLELAATSCGTPVALQTDGITRTSADLSWTNSSLGTPQSYTISYKAEGAASFTDVTCTDNPHTLDGLTPNTTYVWKVKSDCGSGNESDYSIEQSFTTLCVDYTISPTQPLNENFSYVPDCWVAYVAPEQVVHSAFYSNMIIYGYSSDDKSRICIYATPELVLEGDYMMLDFNAYSSSSSSQYMNFSVGTINANDEFTEVQVIPLTSSSSKVYTLGFDTWTDGDRIAFKVNYTGLSSSASAYIDNVKITVPACAKPFNLASTPEVNSALLSWNCFSAAESYTLAYKKSNVNVYTEITGITGTSYNLEGLNFGHDYDWKVKTNCSSSSSSEYTQVASFRTSCPDYLPLPYSEDFSDTYQSGNVLPYCWNKEALYGDTPFVNGTGNPYHGILFNSQNNADCIASMPELPLDCGWLQVKFDAKCSGLQPNIFAVGVMDNGSFMSIKQFALSTDFNLYTVYLDPEVVAGKRLAFKENNLGYNTCYVYLDNLNVTEAPTCPMPTGIQVTGITSTKAGISWDEAPYGTSPVSYRIEVNSDGVVTTYDVADNSYQMQNLDSGTSYTFKVKTLCGGNESEWSLEHNFSTACEAVDVPFTTDFETALSSCWTKIITCPCTYTYNTYICPLVLNGSPYSGTYKLEFRTVSGKSENLIAMPLLNGNVAELLIEFYARVGLSTQKVRFEVGLWDGTEFKEAKTIALTDTYQKFTVNFVDYVNLGTEDRIAFRTVSTEQVSSGYYVYLDDLSVTHPECSAPLNPHLDGDAGLTSATLSWEAPEYGSFSNYTVAYRNEADADFTEQTLPIGTNTLTLNGLASGTRYFWKVKTDCGIDKWTALCSFDTDCPATYNVAEQGDFVEDFNLINHVPVCWQEVNGTPTIMDDKLCLTASGGANQATVATYEFEHIKDLEVRLRVYGNNEDNISLEVGYVDYLGNLRSVGSISSYHGVSPQLVSMRFTTYDNSDNVPAKIYFKAVGSSLGQGKVLLLDDITVKLAASCDIPSMLQGEDISSEDDLVSLARLDWNVPFAGAPESYTVKVFTEAQADPENATAIWENTTATNTIQVSNLNRNTEYWYYVKSNCAEDEYSEWSSAGYFVTICGRYSLPFAEDFETEFGAAPDCWSYYWGNGLTNNEVSIFGTSLTPITSVITNSLDATQSTSKWEWTSGNGLSGNHIAASLAQHESGWLVTPKLGMTPNRQLSFDLSVTDYGTSNSPTSWDDATEKFIVMVSKNAGETWDLVNDATVWGVGGNNRYDLQDMSNTATRIVIPLDQYEGNIRVAFYVEKLRSSGSPAHVINIDNINIGDMDACRMPSDVAVSNITSNTARLDWRGNSSATSFNVRVSTRPINPESENGDMYHGNVATHPIDINGLAGNTKYYCYIQQVCTDGSSDWSTVKSFTTDYSEVSLPWTETFESGSTTRSSWQISEWQQVTEEGNTLMASSSDNASAYEHWLITPRTVSLPTDKSYALEFYLGSNSTDYTEHVDVRVSTTSKNYDQFTNLVATKILENGGTWQKYSVDLSAFKGENIYIAFRHYGEEAPASATGVKIDDVSIKEISSSVFTSGGNWGDASNWITGSAPENVVINADVDVNVDATVTNMIINNGNTVTVKQGKTLSVTGILDNNGNAEGLVVEEGGSLLHNTSDVFGKVKIGLRDEVLGKRDEVLGKRDEVLGKRDEVLGKSGREWTADWLFVSSSVTNQDITDGGFACQAVGGSYAFNYDFYCYDEPAAYWINYKNAGFLAANGDDEFTVGRGYLVAYENDGVKEFSGNFNQGAVSIPLTTDFTEDLQGFNLVGNPYPSYIDWDAASGWGRGILENSGNSSAAYYVYNNAAHNYSVYVQDNGAGTNGGSRYIAPGKGFFVKAATTGNLTMNDGVRVAVTRRDVARNVCTSGDGIDRDVARNVCTGGDENIIIRISGKSGQDEVMINFGTDKNIVAEKMFSLDKDAPSLYMPNVGENYSILNYQNVDVTTCRDVARNVSTDTDASCRVPTVTGTIPMNFETETIGQYIINMVNVETGRDDVSHHLYGLILEDVLTGIKTDLLSDSYAFVSKANDDPARFLLHFTVEVENAITLPEDTFAYFDGDNLIITGIDGAAIIDVIDVQGRILVSVGTHDRVSQHDPVSHDIATHIPVGVYIIRKVDDSGVKNMKIVKMK